MPGRSQWPASWHSPCLSLCFPLKETFLKWFLWRETLSKNIAMYFGGLVLRDIILCISKSVIEVTFAWTPSCPRDFVLVSPYGSLSTLVEDMPWCRQAASHNSTSVDLSSTGPYGIHFIVILIEIQEYSFKETNLKIICNMVAILLRPGCIKKCISHPMIVILSGRQFRPACVN